MNTIENAILSAICAVVACKLGRSHVAVDEVEAMHKSLRKIIDTGNKSRLITTYGDIKVEKISENDTTENQVLSKAFTAIFNNAGFNSGIFTSNSVEALTMSLIRDKGMVWHYAQQFINFYNIAINN